MPEIKKVKHSKEDGFFRSTLGILTFIAFISGCALIYDGQYMEGLGFLAGSGVLGWITGKIPQKNVWKD
ncbi:MAG: hypothetical protein DHS20C07_16820 [Methyloligella sp.]|nr:MAG: hypothetical protein DHS20C07_16820 [Methyloligella sp.]